MRTLQGIAVSPGAAIGEALVLGNEGFRILRRFVRRDAVEDELHRLRQATEAVAAEMQRHRDAIAAELGEHYGAIFAAHLQMLQDPQLKQQLESLVRQQHSPEHAVSITLRKYAKVFQQLKTSHEQDIFDIEKSLLRQLLGHEREELAHLTSPVIVLAHQLTPSETASLDRRFVQGVVTELGGAGSHAAIVARGLEIPAIVGTGPFMVDVEGGDVVIVDGDSGEVVLHPDEPTLERYRIGAEQQRTWTAQLEQLRDLPAETADGHRIVLDANIELPQEVEWCVRRGADGIGLYRTEFLYLGAAGEPTEEVHYRAYVEVLRSMRGRPVVIRTLDLGADKLPSYAGSLEEERNPFLGLRSIRLSLRNLELFRIQLRALLRASAQGPVRIMFPLVSTLQELRRAKLMLSDAMEDLDEEGIGYNPDVPVGMMVEVPAAVTMLDRFLPEVDFISIGTNDLVQYALAVDRDNSEVAGLYRSSHPAVLRMIQTSLEAAGRTGKPAAVCGQMSGQPHYTMLLLGMGLRRLSVPGSAIPEVKQVCRSVTLAQCVEVARRAMDMDGAAEIDNYLRQELKRVLPLTSP